MTLASTQPGALQELTSATGTAARNIGDWLVDTAIVCNNRSWWLDHRPRYNALGERVGLDEVEGGEMLYDGSAGVGVFLAALYRQTGADRYREIATRCFSRDSEARAAGRREHSLFAGNVGVALAAYIVGTNIADNSLVELSFRMRDVAIEKLAVYDCDDLIGGLAGAIPAILALDAASPSTALRKWLRFAKQTLLSKAIRLPEGWCWPTSERALRPLAGLAHGASGYAVAMAELAVALNDDECAYACEMAMRYEDYHFDAATRNWPDFRRGAAISFARKSSPRGRSGSSEFDWPAMTAWCHGAPGIGLARVRCRELLDISGRIEAIPSALETTVGAIQRGWRRGSACLCHGSVGNLVAAREMAQSLRHTVLLEECDKLLAKMINEFDGPGVHWPCSITASSPQPGLMQGVAGIGLGLLAYSDAAPSSRTMLLVRGVNAPDRTRIATLNANLRVRCDSMDAARWPRCRRAYEIIRRSPAPADVRGVVPAFAVARFVKSIAVKARLDRKIVAPADGRHADETRDLAQELAEFALLARNGWRRLPSSQRFEESSIEEASLQASSLVCLIVMVDGRIHLDPSVRAFAELRAHSNAQHCEILVQLSVGFETRRVSLATASLLSASQRMSSRRRLLKRATSIISSARGSGAQHLLSAQLQECVSAGLIVITSDQVVNRC